MMKSIVFLALLVVVALADPVPYKNCGTPADHFKITTMDISPWPIQPGQNITVAVDGSLDEQVTAGSATIKVTYLGMTVFHQTLDLCTFSPEYKCPFAAGPWSLKQSGEMPGLTPKGTYNVQLSGVDQNNEELVCLTASVQVKGDKVIRLK